MDNGQLGGQACVTSKSEADIFHLTSDISLFLLTSYILHH